MLSHALNSIETVNDSTKATYIRFNMCIITFSLYHIKINKNKKPQVPLSCYYGEPASENET
jgi:hypothetical protein